MPPFSHLRRSQSLAMLLLLLLLLLHPLLHASRGATLRRGFYNDACPAAELLVQSAVAEAVAADQGIAAGLLRLHFHDCFVRGCDASVLIDSTATSKAEKDAIQNFGLRGFEAIDAAKSKVEFVCPATVSCADILAFAARDAVNMVGGPHWEVPAGRRDGLVSLQDEPASNLPTPLLTVDQLTRNFARKGLSQDDMITLSGAHTIGVSHCLSFFNRLYNFSATSRQDPSLDPALAWNLKAICPRNANLLDPKGRTVALDQLTPNLFDNGYYTTLSMRNGVLGSDQVLFADATTVNTVQNRKEDEANWRSAFIDAIVRMGTIGVLTGDQGQIRKSCRALNK